MSDDHNREIVAKTEPGDMLEFHMKGYSHWGIYVGGGKMIHLSGDNENAVVTQVDVVVEAKENKVTINNDKDSKLNPLPASDIVARAMSKIGEAKYNVVYQNCEHFVTWCRYGRKFSDQVDQVVSAIGNLTGISNLGDIINGMDFCNKDLTADK